ncbi:hypothetical protein GUY44_12035 [Pimelobacter simplex]|uniref:Uncharacterized protein n=1 Tax=Nocardioides simplex TaxID=2045 RepID=A0A0A1DLA5_NOCSI|nr:hypothetical protein [Pimelobacter simplex]AIY16155.3 hypothetical protein KR76_04165 [Pimelobacter simplex]MCG8151212.1 hypothetical protein [Pimelobacter simplex]GEB17193.1 hypothetical protein NSI01_55080 [Pimelobacter simplex]SFN18934.1 hypothetical protein SAMN05421671_0028 [Pimelobacter simplex]
MMNSEARKRAAGIAASNPTDHSRARRWKGRPRDFQREALRLFALERERTLLPWSYVTLACGIEMCLRVECMTVHAPKRIDYPEFVCIYCGLPGDGKDHLLPKPNTGEALRKYVLVVPSCGECNGFINDFPDPHVGRRRILAQQKIAKKNRHLLERKEKSEAELNELGHELRSVAIKNNNKARGVRLRLAWPDDHAYDLRAFQHSGIENPAGLGLCDEVALAYSDRPYWEEVA